jgi:hypothetical protein
METERWEKLWGTTKAGEGRRERERDRDDSVSEESD